MTRERLLRVLVIGAGRTGATVIRQLQKSPRIEIVVADPRPGQFAVKEGIIPRVDIVEALTPFTLDKVLGETKPDLVLLAMAPEDMGMGPVPGLDVFAEALENEIVALARVPVIVVKRKPA